MGSIAVAGSELPKFRMEHFLLEDTIELKRQIAEVASGIVLALDQAIRIRVCI
jgi:hypothetical protein